MNLVGKVMRIVIYSYKEMVSLSVCSSLLEGGEEVEQQVVASYYDISQVYFCFEYSWYEIKYS